MSKVIVICNKTIPTNKIDNHKTKTTLYTTRHKMNMTLNTLQFIPYTKLVNRFIDQL